MLAAVASLAIPAHAVRQALADVTRGRDVLLGFLGVPPAVIGLLLERLGGEAIAARIAGRDGGGAASAGLALAMLGTDQFAARVTARRRLPPRTGDIACGYFSGNADLPWRQTRTCNVGRTFLSVLFARTDRNVRPTGVPRRKPVPAERHATRPCRSPGCTTPRRSSASAGTPSAGFARSRSCRRA